MDQYFLKASVCVWFAISFIGCTADKKTSPPETSAPAQFTTFQSASVVLGQAGFTDNTLHRGGAAPAANSVANPLGNPYVYNGQLLIPDQSNRILGFNSVPITNGPAADIVLGQTNFISDMSGTSASQLSSVSTSVVANGKLLVADYGNSRVLIWNSVPLSSNVAADVVIGWPDFTTPSTACAANRLANPDSVFVVGTKLIIADGVNNRILIYNSIPTLNGASADIVLGQPDMTTCTPGTTATTLHTPSDVWSDGTKLIAADYTNSRVLIWNSFPTSNQQPADVVLGQPNMTSAVATVGSKDLNNPYMITSDGTQLFVVDGGNNRVLIWKTIPTTSYAAADIVLGQSSFTTQFANDDDQNGVADASPTGRTLWLPGGIHLYGKKLVVSDSGNNRVLIYQGL